MLYNIIAFVIGLFFLYGGISAFLMNDAFKRRKKPGKKILKSKNLQLKKIFLISKLKIRKIK